jgi:fused signal recognition particle receptor
MIRFFKSIGQKIRSLFSGGYDEAAFKALERLFYEADLGVATSSALLADLRAQPHLSQEELLAFLRANLLRRVRAVSYTPTPTAHPHIILITGVNGSGKTTTVAKLAAHYRRGGSKVLVVAADTFRAAAVEQLELWAQKIGVELIRAQPKSDPSAVVFDALSSAKARGFDYVLIDTAGRLQTKTDLMHELNKIRRVCQKQIDGAPQETLFVLDATTGQNGIDQAKMFHQFAPLTGLALSKLDGTAKGGIAFAILEQLHIPIQWVGTGEAAEDLKPFDPEEFVDQLLQ